MPAPLDHFAGPGGEGGIRTPVGGKAEAVFKTAAIDHSATSPMGLAGREGLEPPTDGFGDRYSTNWATALTLGMATRLLQ